MLRIKESSIVNLHHRTFMRVQGFLDGSYFIKSSKKAGAGSSSKPKKRGRIEDKLYWVDAVGRKGIDLLKDNDVVFVYGDEPADIGISWNGDHVQGIPRNRCILYKGEPPIYDFFYGFNLANPRYLKQFLGVLSYTIVDTLPQTYFTIPRWEFQYVDQYFDAPKDRLFCMILRNFRYRIMLNQLVPGHHKYSKLSNAKHRIRSDRAFCRLFGPENYHSYGQGWDQTCYKGFVDNKYETFSKYKFTFAIENSRFYGYVTEKPIQAMCCGSIPVYLGAPDVEKYLPKDTFIDYQGMTPEELHDILINMPESEYNRYRKRIRRFVTSEEANAFSSVSFAQTILSIIENR